ncbi:MAG: hypothetical protein KBG48_33445 [Kofleriaceae bacterium]|nr:hypothetical protein [Kofleriaceae bacterium]MBP9172317.1 hypothetical protein [Kofleriaceae bacterium]MBP9857422.1 hypothetical protein [Kofleriaceae bacterium]
MFGRWTAAALALALVAACTSPKSKTCRAICARESECNGNQRSESSGFDEGECVAACAALENDKNPFIAGQVTNRADCLRTTTTCSDYQACAGK